MDAGLQFFTLLLSVFYVRGVEQIVASVNSLATPFRPTTFPIFHLHISPHWTHHILPTLKNQKACESDFSITTNGIIYLTQRTSAPFICTLKVLCLNSSTKDKAVISLLIRARDFSSNSFDIAVSEVGFAIHSKQFASQCFVPPDLTQLLSDIIPLYWWRQNQTEFTDHEWITKLDTYSDNSAICCNYSDETGDFALINRTRGNLLMFVKLYCSESGRRRQRRQLFSNFHAPVFSQSSYSCKVLEEIPIGSQIIQITATDVDQGSSGIVQYSLLADRDQRSLGIFQINGTSGWVLSMARIDREDMTSHRVKVRAQDQGVPSNTAEVFLTIIVDDINDHAPEFEQAYYNLSVSEVESPGYIVARVQANDLDIGVNKLIVYSMQSANSNPLTDFSIDSTSGDISVARRLDRETIAQYRLSVCATDQAVVLEDRKSSTVMVNVFVIDYNDVVPRFNSTEYIFTVREDVNVTHGPVAIGSVKALDEDSGDNGVVRYSISFGNPNPPVFNIVPETGQLLVVTPLDRDVSGGAEYNLRVRAKDLGVPSLSSNVNVKVIIEDVNDNTPFFRFPNYTFSIYEDHAVNDSIATMSATDADSGLNAALRYSIISNTLLPFVINPETGVLTNNQSLDREKTPKYEFIVKVTDLGTPPLSTTANIFIIILDVNDCVPEFTQPLYTAVISEASVIQSEVLTVTAVDLDEFDPTTYVIRSGNPAADFIITREQSFGVIRVNKHLSYDRQRYYTLAVQATDTVGHSSECIVQINVTDQNKFAPVFRQNQYFFNVSEDKVKRTPIGLVQADDADSEQNGQVTYYFIYNGQPIPFQINSSTGEISVNDTLDRDNPLTQEFHIDVMAHDNGIPQLQSDSPTTVNIYIVDVNDNAPIFTQYNYSASIKEDAPVHRSVIAVSATDKDQPGTDNSRVMYTFDGGDDGNGSFYIEHATGTVRVNKPLDRETVAYYTLVVVARDMSTTRPLSTSVAVSVIIEDVNDNGPVFESDPVIRRILENKPLRTAVDPPIRATDADIGENAKITFQIVGGDIDAFDLSDLGDGTFILYTKVELDYESLRKNFTLRVQAASINLLTTATIIVKIQDVNDNPPRLKDFTIVVNNYGGMFPIGSIGKVPAFDPDEIDRDHLEYTILSGNEGHLFALNRSTGSIELNALLDNDRPTNGSFRIQVSDFLNFVNASCYLVVRLINDNMLENSVTLRLDKMTPESFMSSVYNFTIQALAHILSLIPENIYIIDIKNDDEVDLKVSNPILNVSFAAMKTAFGNDIYISQDYIKEAIYLKLDLLKSLSAVTVLPFDDTLCVQEPCPNYEKCSVMYKFADAAAFIYSDTMLFRPIRTQAAYKCQCPLGFVGMVNTYSCDTEINLCFSSPCANGGTCLQTEGGFACLCTSDFTGTQCQYNLSAVYNVTSCPDDICLGDSVCVGLIQGGLNCQMGTTRCQPSDDVMATCGQRTVSFVPGSYLMFPSIKSRQRFNIKLSFATRKRDGLLLYNGRFNNNDDFIALELFNHTVRFHFSLGLVTQSVIVGSAYGLNDGVWHTVTVDYHNMTVVLSIDSCDVDLALSHPELYRYPCAANVTATSAASCTLGYGGTRCFYELSGPLLVGGVPAYMDLSTVSSEQFVGCLRDLFIDYVFVDMNSAVSTYNTQQACVFKRDFCISSPCLNKGTCMNGWSSYLCQCPEGKGGRDCSMDIEPSSTLFGISSLRYTGSSTPIQKPWYNSFTFKTSISNNLVMRVELSQSKYVEYRIEGGFMTFRYSKYYYVFDEIRINDDQWHNFEMRLLSDSSGQGQVLFILDFAQIQQSYSLDNSLNGLQVMAVWVGGTESTNVTFPGYSGCIKDVRVGNTADGRLVSPQKLNIGVNCLKPQLCSLRCPAGVSVCNVGWESSQCSCTQGHVGTSCSSVCSAMYNPCRNGGECQLDQSSPRGYTCGCPATYQGLYCEDHVQQVCPAYWWGSPLCGPCNCSSELNFDVRCNQTTGECYCKSGYYKASDGKSCIPCDCYWPNGGAVSKSCDQNVGQCTCYEGVSGRMCDECPNPFAEVSAAGCQVQYNACPKQHYMGVWWSRTGFGVNDVESCPFGSSGNVTRLCKDNIAGWLEPDFSGCTSQPFFLLKPNLLDLEARLDANRSIPVAKPNTYTYTYLAKDLITRLKPATDMVPNIYVNDLNIAVRILREVLLRETVMKSLNLTNTQDKNFLQNMIGILSNILDPELQDRWSSLLAQQPTLLTELIAKLEGYLANLADNMATIFTTAGMDPFTVVHPNVVLGMDQITRNNDTIPKYNFVVKDPSMFDQFTSVQLPPSLFEEHPALGITSKAAVGFIMYRTLGTILVQSAQSTVFDSSISLPKQGEVFVNAPVFTLTLQQGGAMPALKGEELVFNFYLVDQLAVKNPQCVFVDGSLLSSNGCKVMAKDIDSNFGNFVRCSCNHLSSFSVLTDTNIDTGSLALKVGLDIYIGASLSLFCLLFVLVVFISLKDLKSNYIYIQINLTFCWILALVIFTAGVDNWKNQATCTVVAVLLHFFVLTVFSWMFLNALHLYRVLTEMRNVDREAMVMYFMVGYVIPGLISGLSVGLRPDQFGTEYFCWLDMTHAMIWSEAGPVAFCSIAAACLLMLSLKVSCQQESTKKDFKKFATAVWISLIVLPLTFCAWMFALLAANSTSATSTSLYSHLFAAFCCLHAVCMFMAHVVFSQVGRAELRRRLRQCQGHGELEEDSEQSHPPFGTHANSAAVGGGLSPMTFTAGSESSTTTSYTRSSYPSDLLVYLRAPNSSTSSDIQGVARGRRHRSTTDCSSDSDSDDTAAVRRKDIELASSHSSDEDEPIPPVFGKTKGRQDSTRDSFGRQKSAVSPLGVEMPTSLSSQPHPLISSGMSHATVHSTPMVSAELGLAPPPPYFISPPAGWNGRLSDSTASTKGSTSRSASLTSSRNNKVDVQHIEISITGAAVTTSIPLSTAIDGVVTSLRPAILTALDDDKAETQV